MDYLTDIKPLEDAGVTDDNVISAILGAALNKFVLAVEMRTVMYQLKLVDDFGDTGVVPDRLNQLAAAVAAMPAGAAKDAKQAEIDMAKWFINHTFRSGSQRTIALDGKTSDGEYIPAYQVVLGFQALMPQLIVNETTRAKFWNMVKHVGGGLRHPDGAGQEVLDAARLKYSESQATAVRRAAGLAVVDKLVKGSGTANDAARKAHQVAGFYEDATLDHAAIITAAYTAAFDPNL